MLKEFREWLATKLNPAQGSIAAQYGEAAPESIIDYQTAFEEVDVVHRAIEMIINGCLEIPFVVKGGPEKKLEKLLNWRPNGFVDRDRFYRDVLLDYLLEGNAFIYYDKNDTGALFRLVPQNVTVVPHPKTFVAFYKYETLEGTPDTSIFVTPTATPKNDSTAIYYKPDEIIHLCGDNSQHPLRGVSRLKSVNSLIQLYFTMIKFQKTFFQNNAVPGLVLETENVLSKTVKSRMLAEWREMYSSISKGGARSPAILDGGLKINPFSQAKFTELDFEASIERIEEDMVTALGVPYVLLQSGNNANVTPNQIVFYTHTIVPILKRLSSAFMLLFPDCEIYPDKLSVTALRPEAAAEANMTSTLVNGGIITPNEGRKKIRMPKADDPKMDEIRIPQNITGSATNPGVGGKPVALPKPPVVPSED